MNDVRLRQLLVLYTTEDTVHLQFAAILNTIFHILFINNRQKYFHITYKLLLVLATITL